MTRKLLILGALLCATTISAYAAPTYSDASDAAYKAYIAKQWPEVDEQATEALSLAITPNQKLYQLTLLAQSAVETNRPDEAKQWLKQAQIQVPDLQKSSIASGAEKAKALTLLAQLHRKLGDNEQAQVFFQQVLQVKEAPGYLIAAAHFNLAGVLLEQKKPEEARASLQVVLNSADAEDQIRGAARYLYAGSYINEKRYDEGLRELGLIADDPQITLDLRALSQFMVGNVLYLQNKQDEAQVAYQSALAFYEEAAKADSSVRGKEAPVYQGYLKSYEKQNGKAAADKEAIRLFAPLSNKAEAFRGAFDYRAALPYYEAMQGLVDYIPFEFYLTTKVGLGEMLMYGKQWDEARTLINTAAGLTMSAGVAGQQRQNIAILQQNAQRLLAYSYVLQGQTQGGAVEYARARELYDALLATPDLNAAIRAMADKNIKELDALQK